MEELMKLHFTNIWWVVLLPLFLMVMDIITGYYNAWKNNQVSSSRMRDGLGKKCAELCYTLWDLLSNLHLEQKLLVFHDQYMYVHGNSFVI